MTRSAASPRTAAGTVQSIRAAAVRWSWSTARPVGPAGTPLRREAAIKRLPRTKKLRLIEKKEVL